MADNVVWLVLQKLRIPLLVLITSYSIAILGMVLIPGVDDQGNVYHLSFFDAFYFVSYMASTIGFGEGPYDFTYGQKLWVSFCIYLTVVGWFYGIGALISVLTDARLKHELMHSRFKKTVKQIQGDFFIILGYNYVNSEIIKKLHDAQIELVLIDKNEEKINHFLLESMSKDVPVMVGDALLTDTLLDAGIKMPNCKGVVSLFHDEEKNLRISVLVRFLNPTLRVIAKSTINDITMSIMDTDISEILNPFEIFAKRLEFGLVSPHLLLLENWIYGNSDLASHTHFLPKNGKYIVCGYGRFGKALLPVFQRHNIAYVFIDEKRLATQTMIENETFIRANPDDKDVLCSVGIKEADAIISGTKNDITNISIMITAKKLNPNIYTIARENQIDEVSIFEEAQMDWVFIIEKIMVNKTALFLSKPFKHHFLTLILKENEILAKSLAKLLRTTINNNPKLKYLAITNEQSYAIYHELLAGGTVNLEMLRRNLSNWKEINKVVPLLLNREGEDLLLPKDMPLRIGDEILFACDDYAKEEIAFIASNIYDLHYVMTGEEKQIGILKKLFGSKK